MQDQTQPNKDDKHYFDIMKPPKPDATSRPVINSGPTQPDPMVNPASGQTTPVTGSNENDASEVNLEPAPDITYEEKPPITSDMKMDQQAEQANLNSSEPLVEAPQVSGADVASDPIMSEASSPINIGVVEDNKLTDSNNPVPNNDSTGTPEQPAQTIGQSPEAQSSASEIVGADSSQAATINPGQATLGVAPSQAVNPQTQPVSNVQVAQSPVAKKPGFFKTNLALKLVLIIILLLVVGGALWFIKHKLSQ